jgi:hypothetical protein
MRKILAITLVSGLLLATFPGAAMAGDTHAVSNRWAGAAIGAAAAVVGGFLLNALQAPATPVTYAPPPIVYTPAPQVVYSTPPAVIYAPPTVVYSAPPVVYAPGRVVVYRAWGSPGHWNRGRHEYGRGWDRH